MSPHVASASAQKKSKKENKKPKKKEKELKKEKTNRRKFMLQQHAASQPMCLWPTGGKNVSYGLGRPGRRMLFCTCFLPLLLPATASVTAVAVECKSCLSLSSIGNYTRHSPEVTNFKLPGNGTRAGASHGVFHRVSFLKAFDCLGQQSNVFGAAAAEQFALTKVTVFVTSSVRRQPSGILASMLGCFLPCLVCCPRPPVAG